MQLPFKSGQTFQELYKKIETGAGESFFTLMEKFRYDLNKKNSRTKLMYSFSEFLVYSKASYLVNYLRKSEKEFGLEI